METSEIQHSKLHLCKQCGRYLSETYEEDICPSCKEMNLFSEVKEYIRSNDVKEHDVAEHFGISLAKVRSWIREGRIQYITETGKEISSICCQACGKTIEFGTLCSECRRLQGLQVIAKKYKEENGSMRFIREHEKKYGK